MPGESFDGRSDDKDDKLEGPEDWAAAIACSFAAGCGLTPEAMAELKVEFDKEGFRGALHRHLWDIEIDFVPGVKNCAELIGLKNPLEFPPNWFVE